MKDRADVAALKNAVPMIEVARRLGLARDDDDDRIECPMCHGRARVRDDEQGYRCTERGCSVGGDHITAISLIRKQEFCGALSLLRSWADDYEAARSGGSQQQRRLF